MKRIVTWLFATVSGIVLLFSYRTSTQAVAPGLPEAAAPQASAQPQESAMPQAEADPTPGPTTEQPPTQPPTPTPDATKPAASVLKDGTYTGAAASTRYGPVQVRITVQDGQITDATAVDYPSESRRDQMINAYAIPVLQQEAVSAQDSGIDFVSGATYTSEGYIASLQDALDQAAG